MLKINQNDAAALFTKLTHGAVMSFPKKTITVSSGKFVRFTEKGEFTPGFCGYSGLI